MANYYPSIDEMFDSGFEAIGFVTGMGIYMLVISLVSLALYILGAVGAHTIAKRRNIRHPWLAWLPIGNAWIWGCISDQFRYVTRGEVRSRRKVLLGLSIAQYVPAIAVIALYVSAIVTIVTQPLENLGPTAEQAFGANVTLLLLVPLVLLLVSLVLSVLLLVFAYMALYDLYRSCDPDNAVLFLVLSILFSNFTSIFIFAVRKKDLGMPPRRSTGLENYLPHEL